MVYAVEEVGNVKEGVKAAGKVPGAEGGIAETVMRTVVVEELVVGENLVAEVVEPQAGWAPKCVRAATSVRNPETEHVEWEAGLPMVSSPVERSKSLEMKGPCVVSRNSVGRTVNRGSSAVVDPDVVSIVVQAARLQVGA